MVEVNWHQSHTFWGKNILFLLRKKTPLLVLRLITFEFTFLSTAEHGTNGSWNSPNSLFNPLYSSNHCFHTYLIWLPSQLLDKKRNMWCRTWIFMFSDSNIHRDRQHMMTANRWLSLIHLGAGALSKCLINACI